MDDPITETLKLFGRSPAREVEFAPMTVKVAGNTYVELYWQSREDDGWYLAFLVDENMRSPADCLVYTTAKTMEIVPRSRVDKFLDQRLGQDMVPALFRDHRSFFDELEGEDRHSGPWIPTWAQWSLGPLAFHDLRSRVKHMMTQRAIMKFTSVEAWFKQP